MPRLFSILKIWAGMLLALAPINGWSRTGDVLAVRPTDLRPTQACVGYILVDRKLAKFQNMSPKQLEKFLAKRPSPAVLGPKGELYLLDAHHETYALIEMEVEQTFITIVADFSRLSRAQFERRMRRKRWVYFGDEFGRPSHTFATLPTSIASLRDDPYRALASYVRRAGGFKKTEEFYMEFKWANALRRVVPLRLIQTDLHEAVEMGVKFARSSEANGLPGYKGKDSVRDSCEDQLTEP